MREAASSFTILKRVTVILLALIQLVAPTWHICELGGSTCHPSREKQAVVWKPKCGGGSVCPCVPPPGAVDARLGVLQAAPDDAQVTCLARLLLSMPGSLSASIVYKPLTTPRTVAASPTLRIPILASQPQPPARAPPEMFS